MKFYWTKEKRGNRALVTTDSELHDVIYKELTKWFFEGGASFGATLDEIFAHLKKYPKANVWTILSWNIIHAIDSNNTLSCPFEHIKEEQLIASFYRHKGGAMIPYKEIWLRKIESIYWNILSYINDLKEKNNGSQRL